MKNILILIFLLTSFCKTIVSDEPAQKFLIYVLYECEGSDSGNYTQIQTQGSNIECTQDSIGYGVAYLIQSLPNGKKAVNSQQLLAISRFPKGAYVQVDVLRLVTSGPLQGKYIYTRAEQLNRIYLKKCSSILGLSVITTKRNQIMISDKLNPEVLISVTGGYEAFKKDSTTICNGFQYLI